MATITTHTRWCPVTCVGGRTLSVACAAAMAAVLAGPPTFAVNRMQDQPAGQAPASSCVVIWDSGTGRTWRSDAAACATRLSPASTFKIPHALVALATGVVAPDTVERWDGSKYPDTPAWERDHTVVSAMKPSVVWFFQRMAPRVTAPRMREWLRRMDYGNARTDGDVTMYWLNGTLRVSPDEQMRFLRRFYGERLPLDKAFQRLVSEALTQPPGSVENSRGVSQLEGNWPSEARWGAKTGRTAYGGRSVSWLVGEWSTGGRDLIFVAAVWRDVGAVDFLDAARLLARTFIARGLL